MQSPFTFQKIVTDHVSSDVAHEGSLSASSSGVPNMLSMSQPKASEHTLAYLWDCLKFFGGCLANLKQPWKSRFFKIVGYLLEKSSDVRKITAKRF